MELAPRDIPEDSQGCLQPDQRGCADLFSTTQINGAFYSSRAAESERDRWGGAGAMGAARGLPAQSRPFLLVLLGGAATASPRGGPGAWTPSPAPGGFGGPAWRPYAKRQQQDRAWGRRLRACRWLCLPSVSTRVAPLVPRAPRAAWPLRGALHMHQAPRIPALPALRCRQLVPCCSPV